MDEFAHGMGTLFQRATLVVDLVSAASKPSPRVAPTGVLKGVVHGPAGEVASNAKVRIENWYFDQGAPHFLTDIVVYTDQKGEFLVSIPAGNYDVIVSRPDCEPIAKKLKVASGKATIFNPQLKTSKLTEFIE